MTDILKFVDAYIAVYEDAPNWGGPTMYPAPLTIEQVKQLYALAAKAPLQSRVAPWMQQCFGPEISADKLERGDRLLEEVLELLQSGDYPADRVLALRDYVWNRPKGEPHQEVGGTMITLAAYCLAHDLDMHVAGEDELARINRPAIIQKIRAKQAAKPTGSALPMSDEMPACVICGGEAVISYSSGVVRTGWEVECSKDMESGDGSHATGLKATKAEATAAWRAFNPP